MTVFADLLRVLVLGNLVAVMLLSWWTLRGYFRHLGKTDPGRRMAQHVIKVSLSHLLLMTGLAAYTTSKFGQPPTFQLPLLVLGSVITLSALWDLTLFQSTRAKQIEQAAAAWIPGVSRDRRRPPTGT